MIPYVTEAMLHPQFWTEHMRGEAATAVHDTVAINQGMSRSPALVPIKMVAQALLDGHGPGEFVREPDPLPDGFGSGGVSRDDSWKARTRANAVLKPFKARLGFAVRRAALRSWPTKGRVFRTVFDREFDQLQQTRIAVFEPVAILGQSQDEAWFLVQSSIYQGWVLQDSVAWTDSEMFARFQAVGEAVVITKPNQAVEPSPYDGDFDPHLAGTGTILPWAGHGLRVPSQEELHHEMVFWPMRKEDGSLAVRPALLPKGPGVSRGFLPATRSHLLHSAFGMLGERYGWGDSFDRHDCSSFARDAFRTLGIFLPRNTAAQEQAVSPRVTLSGSYSQRLAQLDWALPGDLLFMKGHVMVYLGRDQGRPYVLHAFVGFRHEEVLHLVNQVMVFPLDLLLRSQDAPYLEAVTSAGRVLA